MLPCGTTNSGAARGSSKTHQIRANERIFGSIFLPCGTNNSGAARGISQIQTWAPHCSGCAEGDKAAPSSRKKIIKFQQMNVFLDRFCCPAAPLIVVPLEGYLKLIKFDQMNVSLDRFSCPAAPRIVVPLERYLKSKRGHGMAAAAQM